MLTIRLVRTGKKHQAYFRIVVADKRKAPGAKFNEIIGNYDPHAKKFTIKKDRLDEYMKNGAQPSNTLAKLLKNEKFELPKWVKITEKKKASKKKVEEKPAAIPVKEESEKTEEAAAVEAEQEAPKEESKASDENKEKEPAPAEESSEGESAEEKPAEETEDAAK